LESIGKFLKKTREEKRLTIKDVENLTKIRAKYIEAIEQDNFSVIPGEVYVKGFIRSYANSLDLDGNLLVQQYKNLKESMNNEAKKDEIIESGNKEEAHSSKIERPDPKKDNLSGKVRKPIGLILTIIIIAIALILIIPSLIKGRQGNKQQTQIPNSPGVEQNLDSNLENNEENKTPETFQPGYELIEESSKTKKYLVFYEEARIAIFCKEGPCWYEADEGGNLISTGTIPVGKEVFLNLNNEMKLQLGNPGAVEVKLNDESLVVPGEYNIPITLYFSKK